MANTDASTLERLRVVAQQIRRRARGPATSPTARLEGEDPPAPPPEQHHVPRHWLDELEDRRDQERDDDGNQERDEDQEEGHADG